MPTAAMPAATRRAAEQVFGDELGKAASYAELLAGPGVDRGVVGPGEADRIWERHLLNCAAVARLLPDSGTLVDVGSGAGLPGVVLAILLPGLRVTLLEPMARRVEFLELCIRELDLANAETLRGRAEELGHTLAADVVTARAVAPLARLAGLCAGLLRPGGQVMAIKGERADAELAAARGQLARLGITDAQVLRVGGGEELVAATVVMFTAPERRTGRSAR